MAAKNKHVWIKTKQITSASVKLIKSIENPNTRLIPIYRDVNSDTYPVAP